MSNEQMINNPMQEPVRQQSLTEEQFQKQAELARVCHRLGENDVRKVILFLGLASVTDPLYRARAEDLARDCTATPSEKADWLHLDRSVKTSCMNHVRWVMTNVRKHIEVFYDTSGVTGPYRLDFPLKPPQSTMKGHYAAVFRSTAEESTTLDGRIDPALLRPASSFWSRMIASERLGKCLLVYPIAKIVPPGEMKPDDRGLFSGSGEVAAAFAIGICVPHLRNQIEVRRTMDVTGPDLRSAATLIVLGSTVNNDTLREWRDEMLESGRWPVQAFMTGEENGVGTITKVLGENQRPYPYTVEKPRTREIDYALISHFRDRRTHQSFVALQGISTPATAVAAQYLADDHNVIDLQKRLGIGANDPVPSFELLLRIVLNNYVATGHVDPVDLEIH